MKRFIQVFFLIFCFIFFAGSASAEQAIRIFQQTANNEESWQKYLSHWEKTDIESGLLILKLAEQAYSTAQARGYLELVPEKLRSPENYQAIFILLNNLGGYDRISSTELRDRARGSGVYLPSMRLFKKESGEGFEDFKSQKIAKAIKTNAEGVQSIPPSVMGVLAFLELGSTSYMFLVSEKFRDQPNYITAFTSYNELLKGDVTLDEFKTLGQGDGIWVPVEEEYLKAFFKTFRERMANLTKQEALLRNTTETREGIQYLKEEIARLKKLGSPDPRQIKQINDLGNQLNKLTSKVSELTQGQKDLSQNQTVIAKAANLYKETITANFAKVNKVEAAMVETGAKIDAVDYRIDKMAEVISHNQKVIVFSLSGVMIVILALIFWVRGRDKRSFKQDISSVEEKVDNLHGKFVGVTFDRGLVSKPAIGLLKIGRSIKLPVTVGQDSFEVIVKRVSDDKILVKGICHHANDKKTDHEYGIGTNVPAMIDRAAGQGFLTSSLTLEEVKVA